MTYQAEDSFENGTVAVKGALVGAGLVVDHGSHTGKTLDAPAPMGGLFARAAIQPLSVKDQPSGDGGRSVECAERPLWHPFP